MNKKQMKDNFFMDTIQKESSQKLQNHHTSIKLPNMLCISTSIRETSSILSSKTTGNQIR